MKTPVKKSYLMTCPNCGSAMRMTGTVLRCSPCGYIEEPED